MKKKKKEVLILYFCLLVSTEQLKLEILRVIKKKNGCLSDFELVFMCINVM